MLWGVFSRDQEGEPIVGSLSVAEHLMGGVRFVPISAERGQPDFLIQNNRGVKIGSGWTMDSAEGRYVSVRLHTPELNCGDPLFPMLIETSPNRFELSWDFEGVRPQTKRPSPHLTIVR